MLKDAQSLADVFERDGFVSPVQIIIPQEATGHRARMEWAEARIGSLHYKTKAHTLLTSAYELATHPSVLEVVEAVVGSDTTRLVADLDVWCEELPKANL